MAAHAEKARRWGKYLQEFLTVNENVARSQTVDGGRAILTQPWLFGSTGHGVRPNHSAFNPPQLSGRQNLTGGTSYVGKTQLLGSSKLRGKFRDLGT